MPLSYNMSAGGLMYSPARDYAYCMPAIVSSVIRAFNSEYWKGLLEALCNYHEFDGDGNPQAIPAELDELWTDVCKAKDCYVEYLNSCCDNSSETVEQVLARSGFTALPIRAQIAWMAMLGQVMSGMAFSGLRDVTKQGEVPLGLPELLKVAHDARRLFNGGTVEQDQEALKATLATASRALLEQGMSHGEIRKLVGEAINASGLPSGRTTTAAV